MTWLRKKQWPVTSDEMSWLSASMRRLMALFRKERLEEELDEELRSHLEMLVEENLRKGICPEDARYIALRSFGGVEQAIGNQGGCP